MFLGKSSVCGEPAVLVIRARHETHRQRRKRTGLRGGASAAGRRQVAVSAEPVEIVAAGSQTGQFDVHTVRRFRRRCGDSTLLDALEPFVGGHLPLDLHHSSRHATETITRERIRRQSRPDHDSVRGRVARRHAQRERIRQHRADAPLGREADDGHRGERSRPFQHRAPTRTPALRHRHGEVSTATLPTCNEQPYGARPQRCRYANSLCTLPFRGWTNSYC